MVWAYVAKRRQWLGEVSYGVWSGGFQTKGDLEKGGAKDCQTYKLKREDAVDCIRWRTLINDWSGWLWVGECFFWYRLTWVVPPKGLENGCCSDPSGPVYPVNSCIFIAVLYFPVFCFCVLYFPVFLVDCTIVVVDLCFHYILLFSVALFHLLMKYNV